MHARVIEIRSRNAAVTPECSESAHADRDQHAAREHLQWDQDECERLAQQAADQQRTCAVAEVNGGSPRSCGEPTAEAPRHAGLNNQHGDHTHRDGDRIACEDTREQCATHRRIIEGSSRSREG